MLEPLLGLRFQSFVWTVGYCILIVCLGAAASVVYRSTRGSSSDPVDVARTVEPTEQAAALIDTISVKRKARWLVLAFIPSSLMLSVTTYLSTAIAPIPLLWVVPWPCIC